MFFFRLNLKHFLLNFTLADLRFHTIKGSDTYTYAKLPGNNDQCVHMRDFVADDK